MLSEIVGVCQLSAMFDTASFGTRINTSPNPRSAKPFSVHMRGRGRRTSAMPDWISRRGVCAIRSRRCATAARAMTRKRADAEQAESEPDKRTTAPDYPILGGAENANQQRRTFFSCGSALRSHPKASAPLTCQRWMPTTECSRPSNRYFVRARTRISAPPRLPK